MFGILMVPEADLYCHFGRNKTIRNFMPYIHERQMTGRFQKFSVRMRWAKSLYYRGIEINEDVIAKATLFN